MPDPPTLGFVVTTPQRHASQLDALAKEIVATLRALNADAAVTPAVTDEADFVIALVEPDRELPQLPDLKDRAASALAVAEDDRAGRAAVFNARKRLRAAGAVLGPREMVLAPAMFGYLGLESDNARERLNILLQGLVVDAERLRLRREGWEEPDEA